MTRGPIFRKLIHWLLEYVNAAELCWQDLPKAQRTTGREFKGDYCSQSVQNPYPIQGIRRLETRSLLSPRLLGQLGAIEGTELSQRAF